MTNDLYINTPQAKSILQFQDLTISKTKVKYWEREYISQRLETIQNKAHKLFFFALWRTGARVSEVLAIHKRDVDLSNYVFTIRWLKKRRYEVRQIPMHPELRNLLDYYMSNIKHDDLLFDMTRQRADQLVKKYFDGGNCHKFRHSFAVNWLRSGGDLFLLSKMLGHSSIKVTEIYLQIVPIDIGKELLKVQF